MPAGWKFRSAGRSVTSEAILAYKVHTYIHTYIHPHIREGQKKGKEVNSQWDEKERTDNPIVQTGPDVEATCRERPDNKPATVQCRAVQV